MRFVAHVEVSLKPGLLDPQGKAIEGALPALGWSNVSEVRVGKSVSLALEAEDHASAARQVEEMSGRLLSNPVIEDVVIRGIVEDGGPALGERRT
jgi:phosphoribosylformylglycinamidine synthase subunit PurS